MTTDLNSQDDVPACRICHCTESPSNGPVKLISPCHCAGSLKYVHHGCLQQWLDATNSQRCELCKQPFSMSIKYKPLYKWGSLNASPGERRRLICNSVFNLVSMVCIFWSIYVLIERAASDARIGQIDWSFYVKISVVTIGLIIGVIFLFVQLKLYFTIFMRWRQSNRIIIIRNFSNNNNSNTDRNTNQAIINLSTSNTEPASRRSNQTTEVATINDQSSRMSRSNINTNLESEQLALSDGGSNTLKLANAKVVEKDCFVVPMVSVIGGKSSVVEVDNLKTLTDDIPPPSHIETEKKA